jgi:hypothetical protein
MGNFMSALVVNLVNEHELEVVKNCREHYVEISGVFGAIDNSQGKETLGLIDIKYLRTIDHVNDSIVCIKNL